MDSKQRLSILEISRTGTLLGNGLFSKCCMAEIQEITVNLRFRPFQRKPNRFRSEGASDVPGFMALESSMRHQHRGRQIHSHYMRPLCQTTPRAPRTQDESDLSDGAEQGPPQIVVNSMEGLGIHTISGAQEPSSFQHPKPPARTGTVSTDQTDWTVGSGSGSAKDSKTHGKGGSRQKKLAKWSGSKSASGKSGGADTPTKHSEHRARPRQASTPLTGSGHLRSPGSPGRKDPTSTAKGNIFAFMPYLHFETDRRRQEMQAAINRAQMERLEGRGNKHVPYRAKTDDEMLVRAHLTSSSVSLHIRRTLDQSYYHIDTQSRDVDQVVYRYQLGPCRGRPPEEFGIDPKVLMVDNLWMYILGKDLIVTAFPQRWQQPKNDPLNVLDGIIEDVNSKTREPIRSVYDLSMVITGRCSGVFDRHRMGDENYQFMDMFEASIGDATDMETILFKEFNTASAQASQWLKRHRKSSRFSRHLEAEERHIEQENRRLAHSHSHSHVLPNPAYDEEYFYDEDMGITHTPLFVDKLLDIGAETDLLAETKDIRDEINMIMKVLEDQRSVIPDLESSITDIYREEHKSQQELKRRFRDQLKTIDIRIKDLERMDKQAERIYNSITNLLDLKQKHANAFEARFARDQAAGTARQSQTIMVFTIVTIIFLPLSFIAAIFTINIREFPHVEGQSEPSLPFSYVSKYMFGIGFAISIPLIAIAVSVDSIRDFFHERFRGSKHARAGHSSASLYSEKNDYMSTAGDYNVDMRALENALSAGRSTAARPRRSGESYAHSYLAARRSASLVPPTSRGTAASPTKKDFLVANTHLNANANGSGVHGRRGSSTTTAQRPLPVERVSTGFRMRASLDE
ncbi:hypothetical protein DM02DRAFT_208294 [Periconia macrospinosa]|uniref:Cora-domain-containing protein n=1 Tax=Periconia macrospinosa TaxID=97972 RepID=A0A2V1E452_9PLEO|nr:hypothetical protein DM02DRAFT_208294 [Periconia macrospinosa]